HRADAVSARHCFPIKSIVFDPVSYLATSGVGRAMRMTTEEAFVKVLQRHGIDQAFGIIDSAFMPISDVFPKAGITFWDVAHETNGGIMCDGYTRATGRIAMAI